jgi:CHASE2 domain
MPDKKSSTSGRRRGCRWCEKLIPTLFVTAFVTLVYAHADWLKSIDDLSYYIVGQLLTPEEYWTAATSASDDRTAPRPSARSVIVVGIDEHSFRNRYMERSPLDRCALRDQINAIYAAEPDLLVVDIDLSPADWLSRDEASAETQRTCQKELYSAIDGSADKGTTTVLMEPFEVDDRVTTADNKAWMAQREKHRVRFGNAALPMRYGLVTEYFSGPGTLHSQATSRDSELDGPRKYQIDAATFSRNLVPVLTSWTERPCRNEDNCTGYDDSDLTATLKLNWPADRGSGQRVVFFGGSYGRDDTYITPVGRFYGLEIHAAAFASEERSHWWHALELFLELVIAFVFGLAFAKLWRCYFLRRLHVNRASSERASIYIALLLLFCLVGLLGVVSLSWGGWKYWGLWLSPVPIVIGMLIDGGMYASVEAAVNAADEKMRTLQASWDEVRRNVHSGGWRPAVTMWGTFCHSLWLAVVCFGLWIKLAGE